ncbi:hypothetical protein [Pedobacter yulinensis]|uniref:hypothetical protein n=1 Tax=Pedobacter yulinensis TaxID=2126353 RepID=UPI0013A61332|nr:hypothetical protein [Pedobacter yulinensis]
MATWLRINNKLPEDHIFRKLTPNWDRVVVRKEARQTVYEVYLKNPDKLFITSLSKTASNLEELAKKDDIRLLIFENNITQKLMYAAFMLIENTGNMSPDVIHYRSTTGFDGKLFFFHAGGTFSNGWVYKKGTITEGITSGVGSTKSGAQTADFQCHSGFAQTYTFGCISAGGASPTCGWVPSGQQYVTQCAYVEEAQDHFEDEEGSGGMYFEPIYYDCNGDANGNATWSYDCNACIGGNTGIVDCEQKSIIDSLNGYPCAQALLKTLPKLNTSIAGLIKQTFSNNSYINITFRVNSALAGTSTDGQMSTGSYTAGITENIKVDLNPDVLSKATKEYILVTMYHEALHAYFAYMKHTLTPTQYQQRFGSLSSNGGRTLFSEINGHFEMGANNFLNGMRDAIITYNPSFDIGRAWILARGGVVQSTQSDVLVNNQERDATKPGFTGTKCP